MLDQVLGKHRVQKNLAMAEGLRDELCQLNSYQLLHNGTKNPTRKDLQWVNDLESHSDHRNCRCLIGHIYYFLLIVCSYNVSYN